MARSQVSAAASAARFSEGKTRFIPAVVGQNRVYFIIAGTLMVIVGAAAILFPLVSTLATAVFLGWIMAVAGIVQITHAFSARRWGGAVWSGLVGVLLLAGGLSTVFYPVVGSLSLTLLLAGMFVAKGIIEIAGAYRSRAEAGWGWLLASGIIALVVGIMIAVQLPNAALWVLGLLLGINLIASGVSFLMLAWHAQPTDTSETS